MTVPNIPTDALDNLYKDMQEIIANNQREDFDFLIRKIYQIGANAGSFDAVKETVNQMRADGKTAKLVVNGEER